MFVQFSLGLTAPVLARNVLVPRAGAVADRPRAVGHYDAWRQTIIVAVDGVLAATAPSPPLHPSVESPPERQPVGLAGVLLRSLPLGALYELHVMLALHTAAAANTSGIVASVRLDWLNATSAMSSLISTSPAATSASLW